jgi:ribosome-associated toxin RatA of RatAB toxin-antitoxin module
MTDIQQRTVVVTDSVVIKGTASRVYGYLWDAHAWPQLNPHVKAIEMIEETPTYQCMRMQVESDGHIVTMTTQRQATPLQAITYHQTQPPPFFQEHRGEWQLREEPDGVRVTLIHTVVLDEERIKSFLGVASIDEARPRVASVLSRNGLRTIEAIKQAVEADNNESHSMV